MIQPVTNTMPQMYPCMPMMPANYNAQAIPQNNAVKIDIHNPSVNTQPAYNPYSMPQSSVYTPYVTTPNYYMPMIQQPITIPEAVMPKNQTTEKPAAKTVEVKQNPPQQPQPIIVPPSVVVPQPVITNQPQIINAPQVPVVTPVPTAQTVQTTANAPVQATVTPELQAQATEKAQPETAESKQPKVETPASTPVNIDLNQIVSKLNSTNIDTQASAIEAIAEAAQSNSPGATQLLDTQIMDALSAIIKRDTTQMQAPTPEQIKLRQKLLAGETLTPEQTASAQQLSEMEMAERNKQYAIYTVAILQKLLSTEVEKAQGTKLETKDLPMIIDIVKIAKNDPNPMLRASALASLSYIATPENKQLLTTMFEQSTKDSDPNVQAVATKALSQLSQI